MKFKNNKGKDAKTILSDDIMSQMLNLVEEELTNKNVFFKKDGTNFLVRESDVSVLLNAQLNANKKLISDGIITPEMLLNDYKANS
jgi:hypothetical protein